MRATVRLCGALDIGLPREYLEVTLFPDTENLYTMPDVVLHSPLDTKFTVSPIRISTPSISLITDTGARSVAVSLSLLLVLVALAWLQRILSLFNSRLMSSMSCTFASLCLMWMNLKFFYFKQCCKYTIIIYKKKCKYLYKVP